MNRKISSVLLLIAGCLLPAAAHGHFIWLDADATAGKVEVYFSEGPSAGEAELLKLVAAANVWSVGQNGNTEPLKLELTDEALSAALNGEAKKGLVTLAHDYGVFSRGDTSMHLQYFAKTGPALGESAWQANTSKQLDLDMQPSWQGDKVQLTVLWQGKPLADAEVTVDGQGLKTIETKTDAQGQVAFAPSKSGFYYARAKHTIDKPGELNGKKFDSKRQYVTLTLNIDPTTAAGGKQSAQQLPDIPHPVTSFGGAIIGDDVYVYGGHQGDPHDYYIQGQSKSLWRLNLSGKPQWKEVAQGPSLQGLAMVAHDDKLYRIGGFTAKNSQGEDHDLWSQTTVACFDPASGKWSAMPDLPEPRSSFDAAVDGDKIYVIGGWQLRGDQKSVWHDSAYSLDLSQENPKWQPLPKPPFQRRALSVAVFNDKVYAIGGMQPQGGPTTQVDILDTKSGKWSEGPALPGKGMDGFGSSAFATGGKLYVSTYSGTLYQLSEDGSKWNKAKALDRDRFFHRMLPVSAREMIMVGGASMSSGKFAEVDLIPVD